MFRLGLILIMAASLVTFGGGLVNQFLIVLGGRALAGVGAAMMLPAATAMLLDVFPREERGYAQGRMMMISMAVTAFAPTVIGLIIQNISWPVAYLATALASVVTIVLSRKVVYAQMMQKPTPFDYPGGILVFAAVALITIGVMQAGTVGLTAPSVLLLVGAGLVTGAILIVVSLKKAAPLIQFRLFQIRDVAIAIFVTFMRFLPNVLMGAFVARYVQEVLGLSPTVTGLLMILPILAQVVAAPIGGRMLDKAGPRRPVLMGAVLLAAGLVALAIGFSTGSIAIILIATIAGGFGFSLINPVQMAALSQTPLEQRGMAAGLFPLAGQFGTTLWVALLSAGLSIFMANAMTADPAMTSAAAQAQALSTLAWIGAAATLLTVGASLMLQRGATSSPPASAPK
jgi:MFS family permease